MQSTNLFRQLLRLHRGGTPQEDFTTELARTALLQNRDFAMRWLRAVGVVVGGDAAIDVQTQVVVPRLEHHGTDSRIDLVIIVSHEAAIALVFVEAKVDAGEGDGQLERYAELLAARADVTARHLVYLTATFDPKPAPAVQGIRFHCARWHEFHRLLQKSKPSPLNVEILRFMESSGLSQGDRFSPSDLIALRSLQRITNLMDAVLRGEVYARMRELTGWTYPDSNLLKHLRNTGAWSWEARWDNAVVGLMVGFMQPDTDDPTAYPIAAVEFWVGPDAPARGALRHSIQQTCAVGEWKPRFLDGGDDRIGMRLEKPIETVLAEENQVAALKRFFLEGLEKATAWMQVHPDVFSVAQQMKQRG